MKRGLLLTRPLSFNTGSMSVLGDFDPLAIRYALLYLDEICIPINRVVLFDLSDELRTLKKEGFVRSLQPREEKNKSFDFDSSEMEGLIKKSYKRCFDELNENKHESWMVHQSVKTALDEDNELSHSGELLTFINSLPMPAKDFPIGDLLDFREKRNDERLELLNAISTLRLNVLTSENKNEAIQKGLLEIEKSIINITKTLKERKKGMYLTDFSLDFSSTEFIDNFKNIYNESQSMGLDKLEAFLSSLGISLASIFRVKMGYNYKRANPDSPFLYAAEVKVKFNL